MKIAVLIKQTPDTAELPAIGAEAVSSGDIDATMVINPWDEFAAEESIQLAERFDGEATAITMGPAGSLDALKHALAMGVDSALLVEDEEKYRDDWNTAALLAATIEQEGGADLILTGKQSVDGNSGSVFVGVARKLGYPLLINVHKIVDVADGVLTAERLVEGGQEEVVTVPLPAVISVAKEINEPRYPSFMGIRKASRAKIPTRSASELGVDGGSGNVNWTNIRKPEVRETSVQIIEGDSVEDKAAKLAEALLAEKVF